MTNTSMPTVYVWEVREIPGCCDFDGDGMPLTAQGGKAKRFRPIDLLDALSFRYDTDAHFTPYMLVDGDGVTVSSPRINRGAWAKFHDRGYTIRFGCLPLDFDDPAAHASGQPASDEWRATWWGETLPAIEAILGATVLAYDTKGGARAVAVLAEPIDGAAYLDIMAGIVTEAAERGIVIDRLKDLQRCYRLPFVTRDGKRETRDSRLKSPVAVGYDAMARLAVKGQSTSPAHADEWARPDRAPLPARTAPSNSDRPGDVMDRVWSWGRILEPHGWQFAGMAGARERWFRPGKTPTKDGHSALTAFMGNNRLTVFTSEGGPLEQSKSYDKLGAYAALNHMDIATAARTARDELAREGHMKPWEDPKLPAPMPDWMTEEIPLDNYEYDYDEHDFPAAPGPRTAGERPVILIQTGELDAMTRSCMASVANDGDIYVRGGELVEAGPTPEGFRLTPLAKPNLRAVLERAAIFLQYKSPEGQSSPDADGETVRVNVPDRFVEAILSSPKTWNGLRRVKNLHGLPVVRKDGTVAGEGYDPITELLVRYEGVRFPEIGTSQQDAAAALEKLLDIFAEFPFASEPDRSVAVALAMTACVRRVLNLSPGTLIDSPSSGIGKGLVVNVASILMSGKPAEAQPQPKDEDELSKTLFSALRDGAHHVAFDNVVGQFGGEAYDMLMTSEVFKGRILGQSKTQAVPASALVTVSGRNVQFRGDAARRTLRCKLETPLERPDKGRVFKYSPLEEHVLKNRGELAAAALTITRAYLLAGRPCAMPSLGEYHSWSQMVREPLIWLGMEDPVITIDQQRTESDPDFSAYGELAHAIYEEFGTKPVTMASLVRDATAQGPDYKHRERLREAIAELAGTPADSPKTVANLGYRLKRNAGRPYAGLKLTRVLSDGNSKRLKAGVLYAIDILDPDCETKPRKPSLALAPSDEHDDWFARR